MMISGDEIAGGPECDRMQFELVIQQHGTPPVIGDPP